MLPVLTIFFSVQIKSLGTLGTEITCDTNLTVLIVWLPTQIVGLLSLMTEAFDSNRCHLFTKHRSSSKTLINIT